ncbi:unnamed protein product [Pleuronectes platessa]|uniref:Uncharacterized protein n=1 Tax=Pleuronectes platessa TaxID=8262 RepID=A0A9N7UFF6_PLEPL|nr:unnamed protein product [Pleuronectes platessa]
MDVLTTAMAFMQIDKGGDSPSSHFWSRGSGAGVVVARGLQRGWDISHERAEGRTWSMAGICRLITPLGDFRSNFRGAEMICGEPFVLAANQHPSFGERQIDVTLGCRRWGRCAA